MGLRNIDWQFTGHVQNEAERWIKSVGELRSEINIAFEISGSDLNLYSDQINFN